METTDAGASPTDLRERLPDLMLRDQHRLLRRLDRARGTRDARQRSEELAEIAAAVDAAEQRVRRRRAAVPAITYPAELPISRRTEDILAAIRDHQVVIVAGETGSGKTTQLPKICLELGRGVRGLIGHTQPRRIAARSVAERIAEELAVPLGEAVGYTVRFTDRVGDATLLKLMTDGILLAEIQRDSQLRAYDTLIIDEAHERSLNVDFLLGYLKRLLPRRPDLSLVITSATIDPERFSRHFGDAPVVEVSGRTYPVEIRYRPLLAEVDAAAGPTPTRDQIEAICDAVEEVCRIGPGDVLVFLSGEREIRDTADALAGLRLPGPPGPVEVLPLYARLSAAEQHRVFAPHPGRRIVLATNIAETSLTVPSIRFVVDPGTARISRYSHRLKVQRLPIEPISQASANQRAGRCGRVADGVCVRLYDEQDFLARPQFTDPEVVRTSLAAVILQMAALGLGEVAAFPFLDPPDRRQVAAGVQLLEELGALRPDAGQPRKLLTPLGRRLAQLPIDPRLGRMVLEADERGCLREVMVIAAALSIQDPRERPADAREAADAAHARFADPDSDFLGYLRLWNDLREEQAARSTNQFRKMCRAGFLNYLRVREWQDLHGQLRQVTRGLGMTANSAPAEPEAIHTALLAGLLSHLGARDTAGQDYLGARGARFSISPGSVLFRKRPPWVMAAELVETTRLWGRIVARIEPEWAEALAAHLVRCSYSEPHWDADRGAVLAYEKVTLYGLVLVPSRRVGYGRVDPAVSRELFIRHALVEGDWRSHHRFLRHNRDLVEAVRDLEDRARRRDLLVDEERMFEFYDQRVGPEVVSGRHFDSWWKAVRRSHPDLLDFPPSMLLDDESGEVREGDFPDIWEQDGLRFQLRYRFEPGSPDDGVTVQIPLQVLNQVREDDFAWQVPGLREELVTALIRSLAKPVRRHFAPAPDHARLALSRLPAREGPLPAALARELEAVGGVEVPEDAFDLSRLPGHLMMTFQVTDGGRVLAEGKDLDELRLRLRPRMRAAISRAAGRIERTGLRTWDLEALPRTFEHSDGGWSVRGYPALVDEGDGVAVRVLDTEAEQRTAMWAGTRRLLLLGLSSPVRAAANRLSNSAKIVLADNPHGSVGALLEDCLRCAADALIAENGGPAWDRQSFERLVEAVRGRLPETMFDVLVRTERVLAVAQEVERTLDATASSALTASLADAREQLDGLIFPGFVTATGARRLPDLVRYLRALQHRLERLPDRPARDLENLAAVQAVREAYRDLLQHLPPARRDEPDVVEVRWMIEELRVSLFAQSLRAAYPVSQKRVTAAIAALRG